MIPLISSFLKTVLLVVIGNLDSVSHSPPPPGFNQRQLDTAVCFSLLEEWFVMVLMTSFDRDCGCTEVHTHLGASV